MKNDTSLQFDVHGMSCAGCVKSVERALASVPGVEQASVNFAGQSASVTGHADPDLLIEAVHKAGYEASLVSSASPEDEEAEIRAALKSSVLKSASALAFGALLMADMWIGLLPPISSTGPWLTIGVVTLVLMWFAGDHFFRGALSGIRHGAMTMDTLVSLGTMTAWIYSMLVVLVPSLLPEQSRHQFFEAALFVIGFVNLGKALEISARSRASLAIRKLFDLTPKTVTVIVEGLERDVAIDDVEVGMLVRLRPGDVVPVDGCIEQGAGSFNESLLTGESIPVEKGEGDTVSAGTTCLDSSIVIRATSVGAETRLAAVIRLVRQAQDSKPQIARLVDQVTGVFVPLVLLVAISTALLWWWFGPEPRLSYALVTGMSVLIIACPCALGLAIPMSVMVGLGRAAARGLLIRNSEVLQAAARLDVIVMDKTGTLTEGRPQVIDARIERSHLPWIHAIENRSEHPLAEAIVRHTAQYADSSLQVEDFQNHAGGGISARIGGSVILLGSDRFLSSKGVATKDVPDTGSVVHLAVDGDAVGYVVLRDEPRPEAADAIGALRSRGIRTVMLTGDRQAIAEQVGRVVGIDEVHALMSPEGKLEFIRDLQGHGLRVGMVGDGINDAAALGQADVSFAMGKGAEVAMETADVTLLNTNLDSLPRVVDLSRAVIRNMYQNLTAAFAYNVVLIPVAAGVLYAFGGFLLNPALAGLAMALSSVSVVANAGRLRLV